MPKNNRAPLLLRSFFIGAGAFLAALLFFWMIPHIFSSVLTISIGIDNSWLYAALIGVFFATASWYADRDEEP